MASWGRIKDNWIIFYKGTTVTMMDQEGYPTSLGVSTESLVPKSLRRHLDKGAECGGGTLRTDPTLKGFLLFSDRLLFW